MSQIAQALAKAKERTGHTTAPFMTPGSTAGQSPASTAARKPRNTQVFWLILGCVSLPLTGFVLWSQLKPSVAAADSASASAVIAQPPAAASSAPKAKAPQAMAATPGAAPTTLAPAAPRPELAALVAGLAISAVTPGDPPRIVIGGRIVRAGQLAEGELTFSGIANGQLRFTDAKGAVYTRHY